MNHKYQDVDCGPIITSLTNLKNTITTNKDKISEINGDITEEVWKGLTPTTLKSKLDGLTERYALLETKIDNSIAIMHEIEAVKVLYSKYDSYAADVDRYQKEYNAAMEEASKLGKLLMDINPVGVKSKLDAAISNANNAQTMYLEKEAAIDNMEV